MKYKRMGGSQLKPNPEVTVAVFGGMFAFYGGPFKGGQKAPECLLGKD